MKIKEVSGLWKMKKREIQLPDDNFTYGNPMRPSTPIKDVLGNFYGDVA